jgi:alanyl-tRNA synthetase
LPWDVIKDVLLQHQLKADKDAFDSEVDKAKERSRNASVFVKNTERSKYLS